MRERTARAAKGDGGSGGARADLVKYVFRLLWLVATAGRRVRCAPVGPCVSGFRVWPNDLDVLMHMNNGVYLTVADLGRVDLLLRAGMYRGIRRRGWYPVVAAETIRFRRSLRLWQRYTITTRILGWSERAFYIEQTFERAGDTVAQALIEARFLARSGARVSAADVLAVAGVTEPSPALPEYLDDWLRSVERQRAAMPSGS